MTIFKAAIIGLVTLGIILCLVLALVKAVRACAAQRPDGGRRKAVAAGLGVAAVMLCAAFGFVKLHTFRLPSDADMIFIRSGTTGEGFEISREEHPEAFGELASIEMKICSFSPLTAFRMGHEYVLTYYKDGEAVTELLGKGKACQTYRFPFFYETSGDITDIIDKYIQR